MKFNITLNLDDALIESIIDQYNKVNRDTPITLETILENKDALEQQLASYLVYKIEDITGDAEELYYTFVHIFSDVYEQPSDDPYEYASSFNYLNDDDRYV